MLEVRSTGTRNWDNGKLGIVNAKTTVVTVINNVTKKPKLYKIASFVQLLKEKPL